MTFLTVYPIALTLFIYTLVRLMYGGGFGKVIEEQPKTNLDVLIDQYMEADNYDATASLDFLLAADELKDPFGLPEKETPLVTITEPVKVWSMGTTPSQHQRPDSKCRGCGDSMHFSHAASDFRQAGLASVRQIEDARAKVHEDLALTEKLKTNLLQMQETNQEQRKKIATLRETRYL